MSTRIVVLVAAITLGLSHMVSGQETTGAVSGRVVDSQRLPIPGATVTVTGLQGVKQTVTDGTGNFIVPFLTPGTYAVRIELQGFKPVAREGVVVRLGQTVDIPATLIVGELTETVEVRAGTLTRSTRAARPQARTSPATSCRTSQSDATSVRRLPRSGGDQFGVSRSEQSFDQAEAGSTTSM